MKTKSTKKRNTGAVYDGVYYNSFSDYMKAIFGLDQSTSPAPGTKRIVWQDGWYVIEEHDGCSWGVVCDIKESSWGGLNRVYAHARTLWGIKRLWRKLYGTQTPFPSLKLVLGEGGK